MSIVGLRELGQNASQVLRQVAEGDVVTVTDRRRPVAQIVPWQDSAIQRLRDSGLIREATVPWEAVLEPSPEPTGISASKILEQMREEERY